MMGRPPKHRFEAQDDLQAAVHDIGGPIRRMAGFAELLSQRFQSELSVEGRKLSGLMMTEVSRADALLTGLADYVNTGSSIAMAPTSVCCIITGMRESVGVQLSAVGARLEISGDEVRLDADPDLVVRAVVELVRNAAQHGVADSHLIRVAVLDDKDTVHVDVRDSGPGVHKSLKSKAFQLFQAGPDGGAGVGLAVVRKIARLHGGVVTVEPSERGAWFRLSIPKTCAEAASGSNKGGT